MFKLISRSLIRATKNNPFSSFSVSATRLPVLIALASFSMNTHGQVSLGRMEVCPSDPQFIVAQGSNILITPPGFPFGTYHQRVQSSPLFSVPADLDYVSGPNPGGIYSSQGFTGPFTLEFDPSAAGTGIHTYNFAVGQTTTYTFEIVVTDYPAYGYHDDGSTSTVRVLHNEANPYSYKPVISGYVTNSSGAQASNLFGHELPPQANQESGFIISLDDECAYAPGWMSYTTTSARIVDHGYSYSNNAIYALVDVSSGGIFNVIDGQGNNWSSNGPISSNQSALLILNANDGSLMDLHKLNVEADHLEVGKDGQFYICEDVAIRRYDVSPGAISLTWIKYMNPSGNVDIVELEYREVTPPGQRTVGHLVAAVRNFDASPVSCDFQDGVTLSVDNNAIYCVTEQGTTPISRWASQVRQSMNQAQGLRIGLGSTGDIAVMGYTKGDITEIFGQPVTNWSSSVSSIGQSTSGKTLFFSRLDYNGNISYFRSIFSDGANNIVNETGNILLDPGYTVGEVALTALLTSTSPTLKMYRYDIGTGVFSTPTTLDISNYPVGLGKVVITVSIDPNTNQLGMFNSFAARGGAFWPRISYVPAAGTYYQTAQYSSTPSLPIMYMNANSNYTAIPAPTNNSPGFQNSLLYRMDRLNAPIGQYKSISNQAQEGTFQQTRENTITLYPNPANHEQTVKIELGEGMNQGTVQVYGVDGKIMIDSRFVNSTNNVLNISNLKAGHYIVSVTVDGQSFNKQLVVTE